MKKERKTTMEVPKKNPLAFLASYVGKYKNKKQHVGGGKSRDINQNFKLLTNTGNIPDLHI